MFYVDLGQLASERQINLGYVQETVILIFGFPLEVFFPFLCVVLVF